MIQELIQRKYRPGDFVVFRKMKRGTSPGPRAKHVAPTRFGEEYVYDVKKFWVVDEIAEQQVVVRTRRGKRHVMNALDQRLRRARWWERWMHRDRFPAPHQDSSSPISDITTFAG